jgi:hypothetical protein
VTLALVDNGECRLHRCVIGDIELHELTAELGRGRLSQLGAARPQVDAVPLGDEATGRLVPESLVGTRDERHGHVASSWSVTESVRRSSRGP